jgi:hypothetical protein
LVDKRGVGASWKWDVNQQGPRKNQMWDNVRYRDGYVRSTYLLTEHGCMTLATGDVTWDFYKYGDLTNTLRKHFKAKQNGRMLA